MSRLIDTKFVVILGSLFLLLAGCHSNPSNEAIESYKDVANTSHNANYVRPLKDGAPWWDVDVSQIPDATPRVHTGKYKKTPYTVLGKTYYPIASANGYQAIGIASWYGTKFHGQATANGEVYDLYGMTAAHKTLPLPSYVKVTNLDNHRSIILRVNDRGPFYSNRIIDLSFAAAKKLGYANTGTARVKVEGIDPLQWQQAGENRVKSTEKIAAVPVDSPVNTEQKTAKASIKEYHPPLDQHALPVTQSKSLEQEGLYLQVAAFANPDAAELLRQQLIEITTYSVFISPVIQGQQILYRVRVGPIANQQEMLQLQQAIAIANLGQATLVKRN